MKLAFREFNIRPDNTEIGSFFGFGGLKKLTINTLMSCTKELKCDQEFICE